MITELSERQHLREGERVHERQPESDDGTKDPAVVERSLIIRDGKHPPERQAQLIQHLL